MLKVHNSVQTFKASGNENGNLRYPLFGLQGNLDTQFLTGFAAPAMYVITMVLLIIAFQTSLFFVCLVVAKI